jgi:hypothetical protein
VKRKASVSVYRRRNPEDEMSSTRAMPAALASSPYRRSFTRSRAIGPLAIAIAVFLAVLIADVAAIALTAPSVATMGEPYMFTD